MAEMLAGQTIGANHISAVRRDCPVNGEWASHYFSQSADFSYLADLPSALFGPVCAIELENSLHEQLSIIRSIPAILKNWLAAPDRAAA